MSKEATRIGRSFGVAREVHRLLLAHGVQTALIGAIALAVHGYVRATRDLDLGIAVPGIDPLRRLARNLRDLGHDVDLGEPAPDDPLGGVLTVSGSGFGTIQIVNLLAPGRRNEALARAAISSARIEPTVALPVIDFLHLVALKIAAGSRKDEVDVLELLDANPEVDRAAVLDLCGKYRLRARLERLLRSSGDV